MFVELNSESKTAPSASNASGVALSGTGQLRMWPQNFFFFNFQNPSRFSIKLAFTTFSLGFEHSCGKAAQ